MASAHRGLPVIADISPQLSVCMFLPAVGICTRWLAGEYPSAKVRGWALVCSRVLSFTAGLRCSLQSQELRVSWWAERQPTTLYMLTLLHDVRLNQPTLSR